MALGKEMCRIFLKNLCRGLPRKPSAKNFIFFKKKSLPRAPNHGPRQRNVAEILFFLKKIFAEGNGTALGKGPFFAEGLGHCPRQRGRNLIFFCFLHSIDTSISYIYIYISTITHIYIYHTEPIFSQYITTIIVNHKSQYITTTSHMFIIIHMFITTS